MKMKCECGFAFSGAGEFRNCNVQLVQFPDEEYPVWVNICPECGKQYRQVK
jgi:hypothetical protein